MRKQCKITRTKTYPGNCSKMFVMILFSIGMTLFSCSDKPIKKEKTDNAETVKDSITSKFSISDKEVPDDTTETNAPESVPSKIDQNYAKIKTTKQAITENKTTKPDKIKKDNVSLAVKSPSNLNAEFPGGIEQFHNFFMKEYKKPEGVSYWKLNFTLAFAVEKNGSVSFLECSPAVEEPLEKEIIRVLSLCPKWQPGESDGKKVKMQYSVPILLK